MRACAGQGRHGTFLATISEFYRAYHQSFYGQDKVFLHDPTAMLAVARKDLFEWADAAVVVCTEGPLRGKTLADGAHPPWCPVCGTYKCAMRCTPVLH